MVPRLFIPGKFYSLKGVGCSIQNPEQPLQVYQLKHADAVRIKSYLYKIDTCRQ